MVLFTEREAINRRFSRNKILATLITSFVLLIVPIMIVVIDPIHVIVKYKLRIAKNSIICDILQHEIVAGRLSVYLFNITNADRFLKGEDQKLRVEEVGPFIFQEYRWYEDLEMSEDGTLMTMTPKIRSEFVLEGSIGHPKDIQLTVPNLSMLSATVLMSKYPSMIRLAYNLMASQLRSKAILNIDAHNYLWGYKDPVMTISHNLAPGLAYFDKVGLLDRLYDNNSEFRMVIGATNEDRFSIKSVKKFRRVQMHGFNDVDESEQTFTADMYEGVGYPLMLTPEVPINLYRLGICRTFKLEHIGSRTMEYGGEGYVYTFSNQTFLNEFNPVTSKKYPQGLMDISKCYYGLPYVFSKGHFLDADPKLLDGIDGLKPDKNVHLNEFVIDRKVSVPFITNISLQLSLVLDDISYNTEASMLSNTIIPVIHIKMDQPKMSEGTMSKFVLVFRIAPYIVMCVVIVLVLTGLATLAYALWSIYQNNHSISKRMIFETTVDKKPTTEVPLIKT